MKTVLALVPDVGPLEAHLAEVLSAFQSLVEAGDRPAELLLAVRDHLLECIDGGGAFDVETFPATDTGECRVLFKPSERLLLGLAAMRAGDIDRCLEIYGHEITSVGSVLQPPMIGESGRADD